MSYRSGYGGGFNTGKRPPQKPGESRGYSAVPPPSSLNARAVPSAKQNQPGLTKHGYTSMEALSSDYGNTSQYGLGKRKGKTEDEYFDDDDDDNPPDMAYIPAPGSPSYKKKDSSDDEEDPLDAFMQGLEQHLEKEKTKPVNAVQDSKTTKGVRGDIDDEDDEESYYRLLESVTINLELAT
ncbi:ATP-dependent RNA helicase DDX42, partial [Pseudolycoriella hygida]